MKELLGVIGGLGLIFGFCMYGMHMAQQESVNRMTFMHECISKVPVDECVKALTAIK